MNEPKFLKKQIKYVSFSSRIMASLMDAVLITFLILPLFTVISPLLYGNPNPGDLLIPVLQEYIKETSTFSEFLQGMKLFLNDERTRTIAVEHRLLLKKAVEAALQLGALFLAVYLFWVYRAATPGKMLVSAKIVDAETFGAPTRKQFFIRFCGYFVSLLPFFLGFFWIAISKRKQGWHDMLAGTVVIKK